MRTFQTEGDAHHAEHIERDAGRVVPGSEAFRVENRRFNHSSCAGNNRRLRQIQLPDRQAR